MQGQVRALPFLYGDIFGDAAVDAKDSLKLAQYLAGWEVPLSDVSLREADVHRDGNVDIKDLLKLCQYLAGWDGIVLGGEN